MKFLHTADLHLGKRVYQFSMIEEQEYILDQIMNIALKQQVNGIFLSGDIYDKPMPPEEAVMLLDGFLNRCKNEQLPVFIISGNHDSSKRLAFGSKLLEGERVYISPSFKGEVIPHEFKDEFGEIYIYLLPFIKPALVRHFYPDSPGDGSYQWALETVIDHIAVNPQKRNILLAHQFVLGGVTSESEEFSVGGLDQIAFQTFDKFDYVALGHLHRPQWIKMEKIRYAGSPLKYSFSEVNHQKGVTIVEFLDKGNVSYQHVPLTPLHDMRELRGNFDDIIGRMEPADQKSYLKIVLTDEEDIPNAFGRLALQYPKLMQLTYDNRRTRKIAEESLEKGNPTGKSPLELFEQLYGQQTGISLKENQSGYLYKTIEDIWEGKQ